MFLSESQQRASRLLEALYKVHCSGIESVAGVTMRTMPLIIGPSGSGKTFLVNQFAKRHELPFFSLNIMNWIVRGAKNDAQLSLEQIAVFVDANDAGVLLLDEVNKLKMGHTEENAWTGDVFSEILALLDRDDRLNAMGFDGITEKLKESFFIVGAGAFQDKWLDSSKGEDDPQIGFGQQLAAESPGAREEFYETLVRREELVPQELLFRFSDKLVVIAPPTRTEFATRIAAIRAEIGLPALPATELDAVVAEAEKSQKMFRFFEGYATDCVAIISDDNHSAEAKPPKVARRRKKKADCTEWDQAFDEYIESLHRLSAAADELRSIIASLSRHWENSEDGVLKMKFSRKLATLGEKFDQKIEKNSRVGVTEQILADLAGWCFEVGPQTTPDKERGTLATKIRDTGKIFLQNSNHLNDALFLAGPSSEVSECAAEFFNAIRRSGTGLSVLKKMTDQGLSPEKK